MDHWLSKPQCVSGIGKSVQITKAHSFISRVLLKYSNRTYTCAQNTLIRQSLFLSALSVRHWREAKPFEVHFQFRIYEGWLTEGLLYTMIGYKLLNNNLTVSVI